MPRFYKHLLAAGLGFCAAQSAIAQQPPQATAPLSAPAIDKNAPKKVDPVFAKRYDDFLTVFMQQRREYDAEVIENIRGLGKDAKVLMFSGADHAFYQATGLGVNITQGIIVVAAGSRHEEPYLRLPLAHFLPQAAAPSVRPGKQDFNIPRF